MTDHRETGLQLGVHFAPDKPKAWSEVRHEQKIKARTHELQQLKAVLDSGVVTVNIGGLPKVVPMTVRQQARRERQYLILRTITPGTASEFPARPVENLSKEAWVPDFDAAVVAVRAQAEKTR